MKKIGCINDKTYKLMECYYCMLNPDRCGSEFDVFCNDDGFELIKKR